MAKKKLQENSDGEPELEVAFGDKVRKGSQVIVAEIGWGSKLATSLVRGEVSSLTPAFVWVEWYDRPKHIKMELQPGWRSGARYHPEQVLLTAY